MPRLRALIGYLPVAVQGWLSLSLLGRRQPGSGLVSISVVLLLILSVAPTLAYGLELIVRPTSIRDLVERHTGPTTTFVEFDGYAILLRLAAESPPDGGGDYPAYRWVPVRDSLDSRQLALVRTPIDVATLQQRWVVGRITDAASTRGGALGAMQSRGVEIPGETSIVLLDEVADPLAEFTEMGSVAELAGMTSGSVVRVQLRFSGAAVANCAIADACQARRLGAGDGRWIHLAADSSENANQVLVRTDYPPSAAPFSGAGRQARDQAGIEGFLSLPWVSQLVGWGAILTVAHVEQDLGLPIVRDWGGPLLFMALAALLWIGSRLGYPRFRVTDASLRQWGTPPAWSDGRPIAATAQGRVARLGRSPTELVDQRVMLLPTPDGEGVDLRASTPGGEVELRVPRAVAGLGSVEIGELELIDGPRPGLRVGWFGSQVLLVFSDPTDRDRVAGLIRAGT